MSVKSREREYDIIMWGATGFTGKLAAERLYQRIASSSKDKGKNSLSIRWAIAGRNQEKLQNIKDSLKSISTPSSNEYPHVVTADINQYHTIQHMVSSTHVILSSAGPFLRLGEPIVRACVESGTHYADITGETIWVKKMIEKYSEQASHTGSRLVSMSGFDSIPSDIGCLYACTELAKKIKNEGHNSSNVEIIEDHAYVSGKSTSKKVSIPFSIGTLSSMLTLMDEGMSAIKETSDPYLLLNDQPLVKAEFQRNKNPHDKDQLLPSYSHEIHRWTAPFFMAIVNTRVVRRSVAYYEQHSSSKRSKHLVPYGRNFSYNESMVAYNVIIAWMVSLFMSVGALFLLLSPVRRLIQKILAYTGYQGPSEEARKNTTGILEHVAKASDGSKLHAIFSVVDGGYGNTGTMLIETGILLLEDARNKLSGKGKASGSDSIEPIGFPELTGFLTPASAFGYRLINRLKECDGFTFQVKKFLPAKK